MSDAALKVEHKTARDWLDALNRLRPVVHADDVVNMKVGFKGSDGSWHLLAHSKLMDTLSKLSPAEQKTLKTPEGRRHFMLEGT
jgi:hypothetical protein